MDNSFHPSSLLDDQQGSNCMATFVFDANHNNSGSSLGIETSRNVSSNKTEGEGKAGTDKYDMKENRKGLWFPDEDAVILEHVRKHGPQDWGLIKSKGLLPRSGKSCRLRWFNNLRPDLKRGKFSAEEGNIVLELQKKIGNKWSTIAKNLPGRTDNDVKNFWSIHKKRLDRQAKQSLRRRVKIQHQGSPQQQPATNKGNIPLGDVHSISQLSDHAINFSQDEPQTFTQELWSSQIEEGSTEMENFPILCPQFSENSLVNTTQSSQYMPLNVQPIEMPFDSYLPVSQPDPQLGCLNLVPYPGDTGFHECSQQSCEKLQLQDQEPIDNFHHLPLQLQDREPIDNFHHLPPTESLLSYTDLIFNFEDINSIEQVLEPTEELPSGYGKEWFETGSYANYVELDGLSEVPPSEYDISHYLNLDSNDPVPD